MFGQAESALHKRLLKVLRAQPGMDQLQLAFQAESEPNFVDSSFKQNPAGSNLQNFNQWQPVDDFLLKYGRQVDEEGAMNGGSSHGSQTAIGSPHRGVFGSGI